MTNGMKILALIGLAALVWDFGQVYDESIRDNIYGVALLSILWTLLGLLYEMRERVKWTSNRHE